MSSKSIFLLQLLVVLIIFSCCSDSCPPDEVVAVFRISDESHLLTNYEDVSGLVYENSLGELFEFTLVQKIVDSFDSNCIFKPCAKELVDEQCYFGEFEEKELEYFNNDIVINISVFWRNANVPGSGLDTNYAEFIKLKILSDNYSPLRIEFVSNWNNVDSTAQIFSAISPPVRIDSIMLLNQVYHDIYNNEDRLWYSSEHGLVGFLLDNELFELKEIIR